MPTRIRRGQDSAPGGFVDSAGLIIPSDQVGSEVDAEDYMPYAILGIVQRVYYADDEDNISRLNKTSADSGLSTDKEPAAGGPALTDLWRATLKAFKEKGDHLYCDVRSITVPRGNKSAQAIYRNCLILPSISGPLDYGITVPTPENNSSTDSQTSDGSWCLISFINGDPTAPYVVKFFNSPIGGKTPTRREGKVTKHHYNGCHVDIHDNGDLVVDCKSAGATPVVNSHTGHVGQIRGSSLAGKITVSTKSDIQLVAGDGGRGPNTFNQDELAGGSLTLAAHKQVVLTSKSETVEIFTDRDPITCDVVHPVNIQAAHGGKMRAAREGDSVKIYPSNTGGDIFEYLSTIKMYLGTAASVMAGQAPEGAVQTAALAFSLVDALPLPTFAKGVITSGTDYVYLGGPTTADSVLSPDADTFLLDELGVFPGPIEVALCIAEAVGTYMGLLSADMLKSALATPIIGALKESEGYIAANEAPRGTALFPPGTTKALSKVNNAVIHLLLTGDIEKIINSDEWSEAGVKAAIEDLEAVNEQLDGVEGDEESPGYYKLYEEALAEYAADPTADNLVKVALAEGKIDKAEAKKKTLMEKVGDSVKEYGDKVGAILEDPNVKILAKILPDILNKEPKEALETLREETGLSGEYVISLIRECLEPKIYASINDALNKFCGGTDYE
jgi:hypothetical protein